MTARLKRLLGFFGRKRCKHEFDLDCLRFTGIPEPEKPSGNDYKEWCEYFSKRYDHDSVTKRVAWPCCKCGEVFYACEVPDDFKFYEAHHPMEVGCWNMAAAAYNHIEGTDVEDCLSALDDDA